MTELSANARNIIAEATAFDGTPPMSDQALLAAANGSRQLIDFGEAVGIIGEGELDLVVRPGARGRGIGRSALHELLEKRLETSPDLRAWAHGENPAAEALLHKAGFTPVRTLLRMTLDPARLPAAIAEAMLTPEGFTVRAFDPSSASDAADWVRVNAAAFASHPEQGSLTEQDFHTLTREPWFDAEDLLLAFAESDNTLAASAWIKTTRGEKGLETELYAIGVDPAYAGKRLGAAMLAETMRRMAAHDPRRISLYVEGDNERALALYERAGFTVEQRSLQYLLTP